MLTISFGMVFRVALYARRQTRFLEDNFYSIFSLANGDFGRNQATGVRVRYF